jgi:hypothetical protein
LLIIEFPTIGVAPYFLRNLPLAFSDDSVMDLVHNVGQANGFENRITQVSMISLCHAYTRERSDEMCPLHIFTGAMGGSRCIVW